MNELQTVIFNIIVNISKTPGAFVHGNCIFNPIRGFISRYSLASDDYYVSEAAFFLFEEHNLTVPLRRGKLKKLKKHFTYEHAIPSAVVLKQIIDSNRTDDDIKAILEFADCVTLVTKEEDKSVCGLHNSKMPDGWRYFNDSPFARYEPCNIKIREEKILVFGSLQS